jgi:hypothetical protein
MNSRVFNLRGTVLYRDSPNGKCKSCHKIVSLNMSLVQEFRRFFSITCIPSYTIS